MCSVYLLLLLNSKIYNVELVVIVIVIASCFVQHFMREGFLCRCFEVGMKQIDPTRSHLCHNHVFHTHNASYNVAHLRQKDCACYWQTLAVEPNEQI